jgi:hypothetical protein
MPKITVLNTEIEVPPEIYFLLEKEADEYQWDLEQYLDVHLGLKWRGHLRNGTDSTFSLKDVLKVDARSLACDFWIKLENRQEQNDFQKPLRNEEMSEKEN